MFYTYLLKSTVDSELYVGSTNDLRKRFEEHNRGNVKSTKNRKPFNLVYYEAYMDEKDARSREHNLKLRGQALVHLKKRLKYSLEQNES